MKCLVLKLLFLLFLAGCTSRSVSNTPRTAIEQLLLSAAVDKAVLKFHMPELEGKKAYVDFANLQSYDSEYVKSVVCNRIAQNRAVIIEKSEEADFIIRVSSGGVGNEYKETLVGIPAIPVPGSPMTMPELALWKKVERDGIAKFLIAVYHRGEIVQSNHYYGKAEGDESFFLWRRSQPKDDIRKEWEKADERLGQK